MSFPDGEQRNVRGSIVLGDQTRLAGRLLQQAKLLMQMVRPVQCGLRSRHPAGDSEGKKPGRSLL